MTAAQKHILQWLTEAFPEKLDGPRHAGPEDEFIVVNDRGELGDTTPLFHDLIDDGWRPKHDPVTKALVGASMGELEVGMDVGPGTLELGFTHVANLMEHLPIRATVLKIVDLHLGRHGLHRLLDYSAQPVTQPIPQHWGPKGRSQFFREYFPRDVDVQTASAASQVHIDVTRDELIPTLEMLLSLSPILTALTANAPVWGGQLDPKGLLASRQDFWNRFTLETGHWSNVHVGPAKARPPYTEQAPSSLEELASWISQTPFIVHVDNDRIVSPQMPFHSWYGIEKETGISETAMRASYLSHEGTLWWEIRPRVAYGTIEVRPCCQSKYTVNVDALVLGLVENGKVALEFARKTKLYSGWRALHRACLKDGLRFPGVQDIAREVLKIAYEGLKQRGFGEEQLLSVLTIPIETMSSPGHKKKRIFENHGIEALVEHLLSKDS